MLGPEWRSVTCGQIWGWGPIITGWLICAFSAVRPGDGDSGSEAPQIWWHSLRLACLGGCLRKGAADRDPAGVHSSTQARGRSTLCAGAAYESADVLLSTNTRACWVREEREGGAYHRACRGGNCRPHGFHVDSHM